MSPYVDLDVAVEAATVVIEAIEDVCNTIQSQGTYS
jgi:hypothetical protein